MGDVLIRTPQKKQSGMKLLERVFKNCDKGNKVSISLLEGFWWEREGSWPTGVWPGSHEYMGNTNRT